MAINRIDTNYIPALGSIVESESSQFAVDLLEVPDFHQRVRPRAGETVPLGVEYEESHGGPMDRKAIMESGLPADAPGSGRLRLVEFPDGDRSILRRDRQ
jgi:hypothetical protein